MKTFRPDHRLNVPIKLFAGYRFLVFALCALCFLCGELTAQEYKTLKDGIEYAEVTKEISGKSVNINLLRLDLRKVRLDVVHAMDAAIGTEKTSSIATRHGAFAAINAGFFRLDKSVWAGEAAGILKINGSLLSESEKNRSAIFISNTKLRTNVSFERITIVSSLKIGEKETPISGINRERKLNDSILYTPEFGRTTLTALDGMEVVVKKGVVQAFKNNAGNSTIPRNGYVVSVSGIARDILIQQRIKVGQKLKIVKRVTSVGEIVGDKERQWVARTAEAYEQSEDITNGVPQLIKNGRVDITWEQEKTTKAFVETRHPRTAVARLKDGKFLMITVDGRTESSGGIGLQDLAEYLLSLGAVDAMNLDGGGSTTMFVDGKVVNHPSDKEGERKVSDAILVTPRKPAENGRKKN